MERSERYKLEEAIKCGSLPDDAKVDFTTSSFNRVNTKLNAINTQIQSVPPPPAPPMVIPPPPQMFNGGPPPPPPPMAPGKKVDLNGDY